MAKLRVNPGGTVTQATNKSTAVTLDTPCGVITMHNASLAATTSVSFTVNNAYIDADDTVNINIGSGATANSYYVMVDAVAAGSFRVQVRNVTAGALGEALVLNYSIIKNYF
jgi:hypothetical protein